MIWRKVVAILENVSVTESDRLLLIVEPLGRSARLSLPKQYQLHRYDMAGTEIQVRTRYLFAAKHLAHEHVRFLLFGPLHLRHLPFQVSYE